MVPAALIGGSFEISLEILQALKEANTMCPGMYPEQPLHASGGRSGTSTAARIILPLLQSVDGNAIQVLALSRNKEAPTFRSVRLLTKKGQQPFLLNSE